MVIGYISYHNTNINTIGWSISLTAIVLMRTVIALLARSSKKRQIFYIPFTISGFLLGVLLGSFYWVFYSEIDPFQRMVILLFFAGLASGATTTLAAWSLSFFTLVLPVYIPAFLRNIMDTNHDSILVALLILVYILFVTIVFFTNKKMLRDNIQLFLCQDKLNKKLSLLSITDELTNLANRRYFHQCFKQDWKRAKRTKQTMSLLIIDIDYFKSCNDNYGHLYGDKCLKQIAKVLHSKVKRKTDLAARYGGDEFVIILNNTSLEQTRQFAKNLIDSINDLKIKNEYSLIDDYVTATIGAINRAPKIDEDEDILFNEADQILYEAKLKGRNTFLVR